MLGLSYCMEIQNGVTEKSSRANLFNGNQKAPLWPGTAMRGSVCGRCYDVSMRSDVDADYVPKLLC